MTSIAQRSFAGGEISPSCYARTDMTKYATGLRTCRNMIVQRHGGVTNRSGTEFVGEVKDSTVKARLIPFEISTTTGVVLEFGNNYIRFIESGALLNAAAVATAWSALVTYAVGDLVLSGGIYYQSILAGINHLPPNGTYWRPLTDGILEIPAFYATADLPDLQFVQSGSTMTITHRSYLQRELVRVGPFDWRLSAIVSGTRQASPFGLVPTGGGAGINYEWAVSAINADTGEESMSSSSGAVPNQVPSIANPVNLAWFAPPTGTILRYDIYRRPDGGTFGYVGSSTTLGFIDIGQAADLFHIPQEARDPFPTVDYFPAAVANYQQRRVYAGSNNFPETVWASKTGFPYNFMVSFPLQDDDAVTFAMVGRRRNAIRHMLDLGRLVVFTSAEEKMVEGDQAGILRPDAINPRKLSANGIGSLRPLEIDDSAVYVQARGTKVRDFKPVSADSYEGSDLTVFAAHLFDGYTIADWDYAQNPHSIVWCARSDGILLGLTYLREHAIWGWHRHDTDGLVENVCVVPEGAEDAVYLVVKRTINGVTKRYIERLSTRFFTEQEDYFFVDCGLSYDGWNAGATTMTISGGVNWDELEALTLTANAGSFIAGDVGNVFIVVLKDAAGVELGRVRMSVEGYTSPTIVTARPDKTVPVGLQGVAVTSWARAVDQVAGLSHLEGKAVSVLGDGYVVASPNNAAYPSTVVTGGTISFEQCYAVIHVGLPYISDVATLDLDAAGQMTVKDKKMLINKLGIFVQESRGIWAGMPDQPTAADPLNGLEEFKAREDEDYDTPTSPRTDYIEVITQGAWNTNGRQLIRQVDPLPLTVLSITPIGYLPT